MFVAFVVFKLCNKQECLCKNIKEKSWKERVFYDPAQWFYCFIAIQIIEITAYFFLVEKRRCSCHIKKPVSSLIDENVCEAIKTSIRSPLVGRIQENVKEDFWCLSIHPFLPILSIPWAYYQQTRLSTLS